MFFFQLGKSLPVTNEYLIVLCIVFAILLNGALYLTARALRGHHTQKDPGLLDYCKEEQLARMNYLKQVEICESVRITIKQIIAQSNDPVIKAKANSLPATESILRAASLFSNLDTEEKLRAFIDEHIINDLKLTETQKEYLKKQSLELVQESDESKIV